ncbi:MAG: hypothetical protein JW937_04290, partial [Candidatus Omnitrophica bacterium]|nr:hypothetical protein [Candidatus Omnitrophota bacterium]
GLQGILPKRSMQGVSWVRPLLGVWREDLRECLRFRDLGWREDETNADPVHLRNRIRLELLPFLESEYQPNLKSLLSQLAESLQADRQWIEQCAEDLWPRICAGEEAGSEFGECTVILQRPELLDQPEALRRELLRHAVRRVMGREKRLTYTHWLALSSLVESEAGARILELPLGVRALRQRERVYIGPARMIESKVQSK